MKAIVVDIDETIIDTRRRRRAIWKEILGVELTIREVESMRTTEIISRYSPSGGHREKWLRFWRTALCIDRRGERFLSLDRPVPWAVEVLRQLSRRYSVVYITNRVADMRDLTLTELRRFGFPLVESQIYMARHFEETSRDPLASRSKSLEEILDRYEVVAVVDDYPDFFAVYREAGIPVRVGFLRSLRFSMREYLRKGASHVARTWPGVRRLIAR